MTRVYNGQRVNPFVIPIVSLCFLLNLPHGTDCPSPLLIALMVMVMVHLETQTAVNHQLRRVAPYRRLQLIVLRLTHQAGDQLNNSRGVVEGFKTYSYRTGIDVNSPT